MVTLDLATAHLMFIDERGTNMKLICQECDWHGQKSDVLIGRNPFAPDEELMGCPDCKEPNVFREACDEPGCWAESSCGFPTPSGYRRTCGKHYCEATAAVDGKSTDSP